MIRLQLFIIFLLLLPAGADGQGRSRKADRPLNVIILIGDGMGTSQLTIPYAYGKKEPVFSQFENIGLVQTSSATHKVTDSAAGSTAMFTGKKTYNNAIGVDVDTVFRDNMVELLSERGYMTGVVTSSSVTDATPAGFYAHAVSRTMHTDIAQYLLASEIDFFAGGGLKYFLSSEGRDFFAENNIALNLETLEKIRRPEENKRYGFLLAMDGMPKMQNGREDFLPEATKIALDYLSGPGTGFLLMVEGAQMDWAGHGNDAEYMIAEMRDFEATVSAAYKWARRDGNTLLIVTADHETGGFTLGASGDNLYGADYKTIEPTFSTTNHSAALVPLLAYGPGSEQFRGIMQNTDIFDKVMRLVKKR